MGAPPLLGVSTSVNHDEIVAALRGHAPGRGLSLLLTRHGHTMSTLVEGTAERSAHYAHQGGRQAVPVGHGWRTSKPSKMATWECACASWRTLGGGQHAASLRAVGPLGLPARVGSFDREYR